MVVPPRPRAILFGSIGTLAETSYLQRSAFNTAFAEAGLLWDWSAQDYAGMLKMPGGEQRIANFANAAGLEVDIHALHRRKTELFNQWVQARGAAMRPGVSELMSAAREKGVKVALVTTTSVENIDAVLNATGLGREIFSFIGDVTMVQHRKPAADIYVHALQSLGLDPCDAVAIEDTLASLSSAAGAGIGSIAFYNQLAADEPTDDAIEAVSDLSKSRILNHLFESPRLAVA